MRSENLHPGIRTQISNSGRRSSLLRRKHKAIKRLKKRYRMLHQSGKWNAMTLVSVRSMCLKNLCKITAMTRESRTMMLKLSKHLRSIPGATNLYIMKRACSRNYHEDNYQTSYEVVDYRLWSAWASIHLIPTIWNLDQECCTPLGLLPLLLPSFSTRNFSIDRHQIYNSERVYQQPLWPRWKHWKILSRSSTTNGSNRRSKSW